MLNWVITAVACCGLVLGVVALLSPIPIGIFILGASIAALIYTSPKARSLIQSLRHRFIWFNDKFHWLEAKLEQKYHKLWHAFVQTRPKRSSENESKPD